MEPFSIIELMTSVLTVAALGFAVYQYRKEIGRRKAEKSLELSKEFAEKIIPLSSVLQCVYQHIGFVVHLQSKITGKDLDFRHETLSRLLYPEEIHKIESCHALTNDHDSIVAGVNSSPTANISLFKGEETEIKLQQRNTVAQFASLRRDLLNILEWFSMQFNIGVADEKCVYQSLHATFCSLIELLYYDICLRNKNKDTASLLYTNCMKLYWLWNARHREIAAKEQRDIRKVRNKSITSKTLGG